MRTSRIFPLVLCIMLLWSCGNTNRLDVDTSAVQVEPVRIKRMEQDLFSMNPGRIQEDSKKMMDKYGKFYVSFLTTYMNDGGVTDSTYGYNLKQFITNSDIRTLYSDCQQKYGNISDLEDQFTDAFRHYKYYFPERKLPSVVTLISGWNVFIVDAENTLGIGLDMYMGQDYKYYEMMPDLLPLYKRKKMRKEYILPDALKGWMMTEMKYNMDKHDFLSTIVHQGKILYMVDAMLPQVHDTLKMGYTGQQLEWCRENEHNMWAFFLEKEMLYSTDNSEIQKYITEGPFTAAFNKQSPAQVGSWIGWQIVRTYMNKNPEVTLEQLMNETDAQRILTKAKYKPDKS